MRLPRFTRLVLALGGLVLGAVAPSCSGGADITQCQDGTDNDGDGLIDESDPACAVGDVESPDPVFACNDTLDNDGDGLTDFPEDPGCVSAIDDGEFNMRMPDCMDGEDNDGDGKIDYPADPGCRVPNQEDELDDCPDGPHCAQCANGDDDDGDGQADFPADTGCAAASDPGEFMIDPDACGTGTVIVDLPSNGMVADVISNTGTSHVQSATCNGRGAERAYVVIVDHPVTMVASTDSGGTFVDTVLYVRGTCLQAGSELACNDNVSATNNKSRLTVELTPGTYYLVVDGRDVGANGPFQMSVKFFEALGQPCTGPDHCAPGYTCRPVAPSTTATCELPVCSDHRDDDGDTLIDYPADPGCASLVDDSETDDCPDGPLCPACANGDDDDLDGATDYPMDGSCAAASATSEADCPIELDGLLPITGPSMDGSTIGADNSLAPTCGATFDMSAPEVVYLLDLKVTLADLEINVDADFDDAHSLVDATCTSTIQCEDFDTIERGNVPPGRYGIVIDGWSSDQGDFTLDIHGTIAVGGACNDPLVAAGVISCLPGSACDGAPGLERCVPAACNDATDADGDGFNGFPTDPGCTSNEDNDETDDCPDGPNCPQCGNHDDDDGDGFTDFPMDFGCVAASGTNEECASVEPLIPFTGNVVGASTAGHLNDVDLTCGPDGGDDVYRLRLTAPLAELRANTVGSSMDTILALKRGGCASFDLQCDDDSAGGVASSVFLVDLPAGDYFLVVDDKGAPGTYNLNVSGLYADGAACDPASTQFACTAGHACRGATPTCVLAACNDTLDADGDGKVGYPTDPGCISTSDDDETDTCPSGPGCPVCADTVDNDVDGFIDYPMDPSCTSASAESEAAACLSGDPVTVFTTNLTGASTGGHVNDVALSCPFGDGRDDIYRVFVTQALLSLTADTDGSAQETAIAIRAGTCNGSVDLDCGIDNSGVDDARATITTVAAGEYFVIVDDVGASVPGTYNLHVTGVIPPAATCNPASTSFVCSAGFACAGATPTCVVAACNDAIDADGDGRVGFPTDPGCASISDNDETDTCPSGPGCPVCANGVDDDLDGHTDYPADLGCSAASSGSELECQVESDPIVTVNASVFGATTATGTDDFEPICGFGFGTSAPDRVHFLTLRVPVASLTMDTENSTFDTTLSFSESTCDTIIECDDDDAVTGNNSLITRTSVTPGTYAIIVDGYSSGSGPYFLNVRGTIAAGSACNDPLVAAGVLTCAPGTSCQANICSP